MVHMIFLKIFLIQSIQLVWKKNTSLAVLVDVQGPKIRIGDLEQPSINLITGNLIEITIDDIKGNEKIISTSYKQLVMMLKLEIRF